jgi:protein TonB
MHFSDNKAGPGSKLTKIAIVTVLHLAVGAALISNMNSKSFSLPKAVDELVLFLPEAPKPPPPPPEPPQPKQKAVTQPKIFTPPVEVAVPQEPTVEAPLQASAEPAAPADPGPATVDAPPSAAPGEGKIFSAALANADACAKPDYPARAARNGEAGTVSLALLIGVDGRVSDSKVQRSSGSRELDKAAQAALSLCQFKPAMQGGVAQPAWGQIAYVWTLD